MAEEGVVGVWTLVGVDAVGSEANGVEGWGGEGRKKGAKVGRSAEDGHGVMGSSPISSREFLALWNFPLPRRTLLIESRGSNAKRDEVASEMAGVDDGRRRGGFAGWPRRKAFSLVSPESRLIILGRSCGFGAGGAVVASFVGGLFG